jgi:GNAT superfamily N-acetyltransferase
VNTLYLGDQEVDAYLRDLAERLLASGDACPKVWFPIGLSGEALVERLLRVAPALINDTVIVRANYDRSSDQVTLADAAPPVAGRPTLVIDSSVHSGSTMLKVLRAVAAHGPSTLSSYTLVLKRSAMLIPSMWGVLIDDHDRAYFLLDKLPNNRLHRMAHVTHVRRLTQSDLSMPRVESGVDSLDRITWADRYYDMRASQHERRTYLLEERTHTIGYLTVSLAGASTLRIDEVVIATTHHGSGHAGSLLRWAETYARHLDCEKMELWAIENRRGMYLHQGFKPVVGSEPMNLDGEVYHLMHKHLIHRP